MPFPTALPPQRTSTASPASKSPSTSTTPTGSRLVPRSRSASSAPSSTVTRPLAGEGARHGGALDAVGDRHRDPGGGGHLGGHHLRAHAAGAERRSRHAD